MRAAPPASNPTRNERIGDNMYIQMLTLKGATAASPGRNGGGWFCMADHGTVCTGTYSGSRPWVTGSQEPKPMFLHDRVCTSFCFCSMSLRKSHRHIEDPEES